MIDRHGGVGPAACDHGFGRAGLGWLLRRLMLTRQIGTALLPLLLLQCGSSSAAAESDATLTAAAGPPPPSPLVTKLLKSLTLKQKVGQMTQLSAGMLIGKDGRLDAAKAQQIFGEYGVGSVLSNPRHGCINDTTSASSVAAWREIVGEYQHWVLSNHSSLNATVPSVPLLWGLDSTHGAGYIDNATLFPHSFGAVAAFRPEYIERQARITMLDSRAAGIPWIFSPILGLANNPLWSRFCACACFSSRTALCYECQALH